MLQSPGPAPAPVAVAAPKPTPPPPVAPPRPPPAPDESPAAPADTLPGQVQTLAERLNAAVDLLKSPTWSEADAQQARALIDSTYAPLIQQLGLNAADAAAFNGLLAQRFDADRAALATAASQGFTLADNPAEFALLERTAVTPVEIQIHTLLGNDGYQQYQACAAPIRFAVAATLRQNSR
jgi:hypothetical protein